MNRILIGSGNDKIEIVKKDKVIVNVTHDVNVLIENDSFNEYVFNVYDSNLNILVTKEKKNDMTYEINVNKGTVSFNNVSYGLGNVFLNVNLNKEESTVLIHNSVIAKKKLKYFIKVNHNKNLTNSFIYNNGITKDDGAIEFNVSSYVPKKSKECCVNQDSKIITLNDVNENMINPILLIDEYECEAKHAAFIGNFNKDELFYLMSRGLTLMESKILLINGLLIGTLDVCFNEKENLRKKLKEEWR